MTEPADLQLLSNRIQRTERLTLRPHTLADFADSAAMWGDPEPGGDALHRRTALHARRSRGYAAALCRALDDEDWSLLGYSSCVVRGRAWNVFVVEVAPK
ncbi:hypothetical protein [Deinococcus sp.]|uniref:hypothetical protein n=1 Tax=Deinococcus sp. TaxID=47478 RepID=UPI003C7EA883